MSKNMDELEKNIHAYEKMSENLILENIGKIALFSDGELIDTFNDLTDAYKVGIHRFGEGKFSIKEIGAKSQNLGIMSYFAKPCICLAVEKNL